MKKTAEPHPLMKISGSTCFIDIQIKSGKLELKC